MGNSDKRAIEGAEYIAYLAEIKHIVDETERMNKSFADGENRFGDDHPLRIFRLAEADTMGGFLNEKRTEINFAYSKAIDIAKVNEFELEELIELKNRFDRISPLFLEEVYRVQRGFRGE